MNKNEGVMILVIVALLIGYIVGINQNEPEPVKEMVQEEQVQHTYLIDIEKFNGEQ